MQSDVPTALKYQHPELEIVRAAINAQHTLRRTLRHTGGKVNLKNSRQVIDLILVAPQGFEPR